MFRMNAAESHNQRHSARAKHRGQVSDSIRRQNLFSYVDTSSSDEDEYIHATQPRHTLKPPKYDSVRNILGRIAQEVGTRNADVEIDTVMPTTLAEDNRTRHRKSAVSEFD